MTDRWCETTYPSLDRWCETTYIGGVRPPIIVDYLPPPKKRR